MSGIRRQADRRRAGLPAVAFAAFAAFLLVSTASQARTVADGAGAVLTPEQRRELTDRLGKRLRSADPRVTDVYRGRAGAWCGTVEVRNRMGDYTGPRGFVADLSDGFVGRLPEGPERRNPAGPAEYRAMERTVALFAANCAE